MDPVDLDVVWAATSEYPPTTTSSCGVIKVNIATGELLQSIDFSSLRSATTSRCMINDIIFDDAGNLYATDFFGYQIIRVDTLLGIPSVIADDVNFLCVDSATDPCPPENQALYATNGPNGIEYRDGKLIVAVSPSRIVTVNLLNESSLAVVSQYPSDGIQGCDGTFDIVLVTCSV
jgi:hypothetical protein